MRGQFVKKTLSYPLFILALSARLALAGPTLLYVGYSAEKDTTVVVEETTTRGKDKREVKFFQKGKLVQTMASDPNKDENIRDNSAILTLASGEKFHIWGGLEGQPAEFTNGQGRVLRLDRVDQDRE